MPGFFWWIWPSIFIVCKTTAAILAMPGFWQRLALQPLPYCNNSDVSRQFRPLIISAGRFSPLSDATVPPWWALECHWLLLLLTWAPVCFTWMHRHLGFISCHICTFGFVGPVPVLHGRTCSSSGSWMDQEYQCYILGRTWYHQCTMLIYAHWPMLQATYHWFVSTPAFHLDKVWPSLSLSGWWWSLW